MFSQSLFLLLHLSFLVYVFGPNAALPLGVGGINLYFLDLISGLFGLIWLLNFKIFFVSLKKDSVIGLAWPFLLVCVISLVFTTIPLSFLNRMISSFYLVRVVFYYFYYLSVKYLLDEKKITKKYMINSIISFGIVLCIFGIVQYIFYPDLRNLYYMGWDPHYKRIFSSIMDPNYLGLILVLILGISSVGIESKLLFKLPLLLVLFISIAFTYSRSSYLSLIFTVIYYLRSKRRYILIIYFLIILIFTLLLLPKPGGAGVELARVFSFEGRVENWKQGIELFLKHPLFGVGFNTLRFAKDYYHFSQDNLMISHSGAGFDNSYIYILSTTGIIGFYFFIKYFLNILKTSGEILKISLFAISIHSLFLNSFFFPWILYLMVLLIAVDLKIDKNEN